MCPMRQKSFLSHGEGMGAASIASDVLSEGSFAVSSASSAEEPAEEGAVFFQQLEPSRVSLQSCQCLCSWRSVIPKLAS